MRQPHCAREAARCWVVWKRRASSACPTASRGCLLACLLVGWGLYDASLNNTASPKETRLVSRLGPAIQGDAPSNTKTEGSMSPGGGDTA